MAGGAGGCKIVVWVPEDDFELDVLAGLVVAHVDGAFGV